MKPNSKKLLMWLYPADGGQRRRVFFYQTRLVLPDLTESGRHSLVRVMKENQLIFVDDLEEEQRLSISSHGQARLESDFPAFKIKHEDWEGDWTMVLFINSSQSDANFRYLRNFLRNNHFFLLKRGAYLRAGDLPETVKQVLAKAYKEEAAAINFNQWRFGDEQIIIGQKTNLPDLMDIYSGIGKEMEELLTKFVHFKSLSNQQKTSFSSIFDRLYNALESDYGLIPKYFHGFVDGVELLSKLQQAEI